MSLWDAAMAPVRAVGGAVHELDMAAQGTTAKREGAYRRLLNDLQVVGASTPDNTPARFQAMREVMTKHGLSMPPMLNEAGQSQYEEIPTPYERALEKSVSAKTGSAGTVDPVEKAKAVAALSGVRPFDYYEPYDPVKHKGREPWSADEVYDPKKPEHRLWVQSLQELGGGAPGEPTEQTPPPTGAGVAGNLGNIALQRQSATGARPGSTLDSIEMPGQTPKPMTMAGAMSQRRTPQAGSSMAGIPSPSPQQIDMALGQYEGAGGVTTRNAAKVQQSQAAPASTLMAAARAVKAYKASPEYVEMTKTTGRLLNETDLSGPMKNVLAQQSTSDQKRLLKLIHRHGEAAVLQALAKAPQGHGQ